MKITNGFITSHIFSLEIIVSKYFRTNINSTSEEAIQLLTMPNNINLSFLQERKEGQIICTLKCLKTNSVLCLTAFAFGRRLKPDFLDSLV